MEALSGWTILGSPNSWVASEMVLFLQVCRNLLQSGQSFEYKKLLLKDAKQMAEAIATIIIVVRFGNFFTFFLDSRCIL